jgi:hypothetical protein
MSASGCSRASSRRSASVPAASSTIRISANAGSRVAGVGAHQSSSTTKTASAVYATAGRLAYGATARRPATAGCDGPASHAAMTMKAP